MSAYQKALASRNKAREEGKVGGGFKTVPEGKWLATIQSVVDKNTRPKAGSPPDGWPGLNVAMDVFGEGGEAHRVGDGGGNRERARSGWCSSS